MQQEPLDVLRVRRLEVVDAQGTVRIVLTVHPDGTPALEFYDVQKRLRIALAMPPDEAPALWFYDAQEEST